MSEILARVLPHLKAELPSFSWWGMDVVLEHCPFLPDFTAADIARATETVMDIRRAFVDQTVIEAGFVAALGFAGGEGTVSVEGTIRGLPVRVLIYPDKACRKFNASLVCDSQDKPKNGVMHASFRQALIDWCEGCVEMGKALNCRAVIVESMLVGGTTPIKLWP